MENPTLPLTNVQLELLKLYATDLSEKDMNELRDTLAGFCAKKSIQLANQVWEEKKLSSEDMNDWLNEKS